MKLTDHFKAHVRANIQEGREAIMFAILDDPEAMDELDTDCEVWLDVNLDAFGKAMLECLLIGKTPGRCSDQKAPEAMGALCQSVMQPWADNLLRWIDARYEDVDLDALAREESMPEYMTCE